MSEPVFSFRSLLLSIDMRVKGKALRGTEISSHLHYAAKNDTSRPYDDSATDTEQKFGLDSMCFILILYKVKY